MLTEKKESLNFIKIAYQNKGLILITTILFFMLSIALTFLIPKKYTAIGLVYPTKSNTMKDVVNNPTFGYEMQADRLIQLFRSQQMEEMVIERFGLLNHFEIDSSKVGWVNKTHKKYAKCVSIKRTKYLSVEIETIIDDPYLAFEMVNSMINFIDTIRRDIFIKNTLIWKDDLDGKIEKQELVVNQLLTDIFNSNKENASNALAKNRKIHINARQVNATMLQGDQIILENVNTHYSIELEKLINRYYLELGILNRIQSNLVIANEKISSPFPEIYVINKPKVDEKSTSPSFLINGILGLVIGFVFSLSFIIGKSKWIEFLTLLKD